MKYIIKNYETENHIIDVAMCEDDQELENALVFPMSIVGINTPRELQDQIFDIWRAHKLGIERLASVQQEIIDHVSSLVNVVGTMDTLNHSSHSDAPDDTTSTTVIQVI